MMEAIYFSIEALVKTVVVGSVLMGYVAYLTLVERKVLGRLQVRFGPNRVGPYGLLQPIADGIKSFVKEDIIPTNADKPLFVLAPMIVMFTALSMFAVIPFGGTVHIFGRAVKLVIADVDIGLLYLFAFATLGEYGIVLGGWSSGNKYGVLGSLRAAAQMISYEVSLGPHPDGHAHTRGLLTADGHRRGATPHVVRRLPTFRLPPLPRRGPCRDQQDALRHARGRERAGLRLQYRVQQYEICPFLLRGIYPYGGIAGIVTTLFLGGWLGPFPTIPGLGPLWFFIKVCAVVFFFIWERATFPRLRYDQIMQFGWKVLFPLALANVVVTAFVNGYEVVESMIIIPLLKGLRLTLSRFFSRPITVQYPEEETAPRAQMEGHPLLPERTNPAIPPALPAASASPSVPPGASRWR